MDQVIQLSVYLRMPTLETGELGITPYLTDLEYAAGSTSYGFT
jgi:hypothetical protein